MKRIFVSVGACLLLSSCLGKFGLFNALKDFNQNISSNRFVNNLLFWIISPAYSLALGGDIIIFNLIEFWTGDNPISMNEGESQSQIVEADGKKYRITATKNRFDIEALDGTNEISSLVFTPEDMSWASIQNGEKTILGTYHEDGYELYSPEGNICINAEASMNEGIQSIEAYRFDSSLMAVK